MPGVTAGFLRLLLDQAERCDGDCLIPVSPSGRLEPLCAAYHRDCLPRLSDALRDKRFALWDATSGPGRVLWHAPHAFCFWNLNTWKDLARHGVAS
jgi:molybdopterin-guanine dinucleotide biosynthesis protein A